MSYKKLSVICVGLVVFAVSLAIPLLSPMIAEAADASFISQTQISYNGGVYTDYKIDASWQYQDSDNSCNSDIDSFKNAAGKDAGTHPNGFDSTIENNPVSATFTQRGKTNPSQTDQCVVQPGSPKNISLDSTNSLADFVWQDAGTIQAVTSDVFKLGQNDPNGKSYNQNTQKWFYEQGGDQCKDALDVRSSTLGYLTVSTGNDFGRSSTSSFLSDHTSYGNKNLAIYKALLAAGHTKKGNCTVFNAIQVQLSNFNNASSAAAGSSGVGGSTNGDSSTIDCTWSANPLTWFVCPLVDGMVNFVNIADEYYITPALTFDGNPQTSIYGGVHTNEFYSAWNTFRIIATALLVIGGLVMVTSQALGFEFLDAYTIRKALPRLIIATIGISLSWPLMNFAVGFFNTLGLDIRSLIFAPFSSIHAQISSGAMAATFTGILLTGIFLGFMGALSFGLTAVLALIVGLAVIIFRDIALIFIILIAPIGIACYILPNTQRVWKFWIDNFLGLLVMFPIIEGFIAAGRVFAQLSWSSGSTGGAAMIVHTPHGPGLLGQFADLVTALTPSANTIGQVIGFGAYFAPYFLLPMTFRLATGIIGTVGGFVNDRGRGAFDRLKKFRGGKIAQNTSALKSGSRFNPNSRLTQLTGGNVVNRIGARAGVGWQGRYGFGTRGRAAMGGNATATMEELAKENKQFEHAMVDESVMLAVASGNDAQFLSTLSYFKDEHGNVKTDDIRRAVQRGRAVGSDQRTQSAAFDAISKNGKGIETTGERDALASRIARGNDVMEEGMRQNFMYVSRSKSGRPDLGRDTAEKSIKELSLQHVVGMKQKGARNVYRVDEATGRSAWINAAAATDPQSAERAQMFDVLFAAQHNSSVTPEVQAELAQTIKEVEHTTDWLGAADRYRQKFQSGPSSGSGTSGGGGGGGGGGP